MPVKKTTWCQIPEHLRMFLGNHPHMLPKMRVSTTDDLLKLGTFSIWIIVRARLRTLEVDVIWKILGLRTQSTMFFCVPS